MRSHSALQFIILAIISSVLTACGGGGGDGGSDGGGADPGGSTGGNDDPVTTPAPLREVIVFDLSLEISGVDNEDSVLNRRHLPSGITNPVSQSMKMGVNSLAGGSLVDDAFAPYVVTATDSWIQVHSRLEDRSVSTGTSFIDPTDTICQIQSVSNADASGGVVMVKAAPVSSTCFGSAGAKVHYVYPFDAPGTNSGGIKWFKPQGEIDAHDVFLDYEGNVDFLIARDNTTGIATIYSPSGQEMNSLQSNEGFGAPEIFPMGRSGLTRDDTEVLIQMNGKLALTTARQLLESGNSGSTTVLEDLSIMAERVSRYHDLADKHFLIEDQGAVFYVDGRARSTREIGTLTGETFEDGYFVDALTVDDHAYVVFEGSRPVGSEDGETSGMVVKLALDGSGQSTFINSINAITAGPSAGFVYFNHTDELSGKKTTLVHANGDVETLDGQTHMTVARNLAKGGEEYKGILLKDNSLDSSSELQAPSLWRINTRTGSAVEMLANLAENCSFMTGVFTIYDELTVATMCSESFVFKRVDVSDGSMSNISRYWQVIH